MLNCTPFLGGTLAVMCLLATGCQPETQVETYTVPRESAPLQPIDPATISRQLDHILVAIVPVNNTAWFFKLVGKAPAIQRQRDSFEEFLSTVKPNEASSGPPSWELPEGWKEEATATALRAATLIVPDKSGELELTVSSLQLAGEWEEFLVPNVNRWLGQLQRSSLPKASVLKLQQEVKTRDGVASLFELSGVLSQGSMGSGMTQVPAGAPSTGDDTQTPRSENELTYTTPSGWLPGKLSMMRKAAFLLPGGEPSDQVTVTSFPAAPGTQMDDVAANVQRWAGQVGIGPLDEDELEKLTEPLEVAGIDGTYVELSSPAEVTPGVALHVAMIKRDGQVWFFKMMGQREVVTAQRDAFREFLGSVEIP